MTFCGTREVETLSWRQHEQLLSVLRVSSFFSREQGMFFLRDQEKPGSSLFSEVPLLSCSQEGRDRGEAGQPGVVL